MRTASLHRFVPILVLTAATEAVMGLGMLAAPGLALDLILGLHGGPDELLLAGRLAGSALLAIGVMCWLVRGQPEGARRGVVVGVTIYTSLAALLLTYAGTVLHRAGVALWPGVAFHAVLGAWCILALARAARDGED